jgi:ubiquitin carboxyl-terminal hydrolase 4/11/15
MDPQSVAFQPRDDIWRFQDEMLRVQQNQAELSDRVSRLERQREDDSRLKNVWGTSSPFPSVLGGTPQQSELSLHSGCTMASELICSSTFTTANGRALLQL